MKINNKMKLGITLAIIVGFIVFLVAYPLYIFKENEKKLEQAARDYFDFNQNELPTGERVKTISLKTLYHKAFLKTDLYAPYTKKVCSVDKSWVKVKRVDNEFKYYTYLDCGYALHSHVDHRGPTITLNGEDKISVGVGESFTDPGVLKVVDNKDGKIDTSRVIVKSNVDTSRVGTYEISYVVVDNLSNKTEVIRTVEVVQKLNTTLNTILSGNHNFVGEPNNNYLQLSNMLFRVYGINDDNNVVIVADEDVANVNYSKLDKWLDYYYDHLNNKAKKMIVESQFCNMTLAESNLDTTQCNSYTKKKKVYIPSVVEINKAAAGDENFMKTSTMSWVANKKNSDQAYLTRQFFFDEEYNKRFLSYDVDYNYGVRPMMVINGESLITGGNGTRSNPYVFGDTEKGGPGTLLSTRYTGEYISEGGSLWRIIDTLEDGTVKVVTVTSLEKSGEYAKCYPDPKASKITYNPEDKMSIGRYINNKSAEYIASSNFVNHVIEVPIYKDKIVYGEEIKNKQYKVTFSAPNMYEMFSAQIRNITGYYPNSYWLINSTNNNRVVGAITDIGVPVNEPMPDYYSLHIRVVGFLKKGIIISSGKGTESSPYKIK